MAKDKAAKAATKADKAAKAEERYQWLTKMKTNGRGAPPNWKKT